GGEAGWGRVRGGQEEGQDGDGQQQHVEEDCELVRGDGSSRGRAAARALGDETDGEERCEKAPEREPHGGGSLSRWRERLGEEDGEARDGHDDGGGERAAVRRRGHGRVSAAGAACASAMPTAGAGAGAGLAMRTSSLAAGSIRLVK